MEHTIKQKDLARKIGISQGALTNFELGRRKISLEWLTKIARALDTPVGFFLADLETATDPAALAPKEQRLLKAFRRLGRDNRLQMDLVQTLERIARHIDRGSSTRTRG